MEPMTYSPTQSPGSPGGFLPGFLLGEPADDCVSRRVNSSETRIADNPPLGNSSVLHNSSYNKGSRPKIHGPPIYGIFDDPDNANEASTSSFNKSIVDTSQTSPICNQADTSVNTSSVETQDGCWVVVYGFPSSHTSQVLAIFSKLGHVVEYCVPCSGNWMFIRYRNRTDLRKALAHNQRIICGNIMIGVAERKGMNSTPSGTLNLSRVTSPITSPCITSPPRTARPLAVSPNQKVEAPTRDTSLISKAFDLFLGW